MLLIGTLDGRPAHAAALTDLKATWIGWSNKLAYLKIGLQTLGADDVSRTVGATTSAYIKVPAALCGGGDSCIHTASTTATM